MHVRLHWNIGMRPWVCRTGSLGVVISMTENSLACLGLLRPNDFLAKKSHGLAERFLATLYTFRNSHIAYETAGKIRSIRRPDRPL